MKYRNALADLRLTSMDYIPSAASWLDGLLDLWEKHPDALWTVVKEWHTLASNLTEDTNCLTCKFYHSTPGYGGGWCNEHHRHVEASKWCGCPAWKILR